MMKSTGKAGTARGEEAPRVTTGGDTEIGVYSSQQAVVCRDWLMCRAQRKEGNGATESVTFWPGMPKEKKKRKKPPCCILAASDR